MADVVLDNFRSLVSRSATWQSVVGASGTAEEKAAAGLAATHAFGKEGWTTSVLLVRHESFRREKTSNTGYFDRGVIGFRMILPKPDQENWALEYGDVVSVARAVMTEVEALSLATGVLEIGEWSVERLVRSGYTAEEESWEVAGRVSWPA